MDNYRLRGLKTILVLISLVFTSGCFHMGGFGKYGSESLQGYVFTKVRLPLTNDLNHTRFAESGDKPAGKIVQIKEPFSGQGIYVQFDSNAIGDIAKEYGLKKVYFADVETFNVLGIWSYQKIYIYGE